MDLRVAVIGLGYFSRFHLAAWADEPGVTIAAVTDTDPERCAWAATEFGVPAVADTATLLATEPDIVDIVAPPPAHVDIIRAALAPGRTLICQKPFCTSLAEARAITEEAEAADTTLVIHENFRFQPWHRTLKAALAAGQLGRVYQARFALRPGDGRGEDAYLGRQPAFRTMPRLLIHETGVHFIDLFRWLFGDIRGVYADLRRLNPVIAGEDAGLMILDHASGAQTVFDGNRLADHATDNPRRTMGEMWVEGAGGTLRLDGQGRVWHRGTGEIRETELPLIAPIDDLAFGGGCVAALIRHVVDARRGEAAYENTARAYLPVIAAVDAAYASAETGKKIALG